jgi:hypothetical protein
MKRKRARWGQRESQKSIAPSWRRNNNEKKNQQKFCFFLLFNISHHSVHILN